MSIYNLLNIGLEDNLVADELTDDVVNETLDVEESADAEIAEMEEAENEIAEDETKIEILEATGDELEGIADSLESILKRGRGLDRQSHVFLRNHLNAIEMRLGIEIYTPSNESFEFTGSSIQATQDSLESIKETIGKVLTGIKNTFKTMGEAFARWVNASSLAYKRLDARIDGMIKKVKEVDDEGGSKEISLSSNDDTNKNLIAKLLISNDNTTDNLSIVKPDEFFEDPFGRISYLHTQILDKMIASLDEHDYDRVKVNSQMIDELVRLLNRIGWRFTDTKTKDNPVYGHTLYRTIPGGILEATTSDKSSGISVKLKELQADDIKINTLPSLNKKDALKLLEGLKVSVSESSKFMRGKDKLFESADANKVINDVFNLKINEEAGYTDEAIKTQKALATSIRNVLTTESRIVKLTINLHAKTVKSALTWVSRSLEDNTK